MRSRWITLFVDLDRAHPAALTATPAAFPIVGALASSRSRLLTVINPVLRSCEIARFGGFGHRGADGIEVHVGRTCEQTRFIEKELRPKSPFKEVTADLVLSVTAPGDVLRQTPHVPAHVGQASTPL